MRFVDGHCGDCCDDFLAVDRCTKLWKMMNDHDEKFRFAGMNLCEFLLRGELLVFQAMKVLVSEDEYAYQLSPNDVGDH